MNDVIKVEILPGRDFYPVFDSQHFTLILVWWAETSLKNMIWETWVILRPWWPFLKKLSFFTDIDAELYYPVGRKGIAK